MRVQAGGRPALPTGPRLGLRPVFRRPNDSMVVAFFAVFAGARVAAVVRVSDASVARLAGAFAATFLAAAFFAVAFFAAAFVAGAFVAGAFVAGAFVAGTFLVRAGAAVAEVAFFRAARAVVGVGLPPGVFASVAPVARLAAVVTFFAAALFGIGAFRAPVAFRALLGLVAAWAIVTPPRLRRCRGTRRRGRPMLGGPVSSPGSSGQTRTSRSGQRAKANWPNERSVERLSR